MTEKTKPTISTQGSCYPSSGREGYVSANGLTRTEVKTMQAAFLGHKWITVKNGRLRSAPMHERPPTPTKDPKIVDFWPPVSRGRSVKQMSLEGESLEHHFPAIYISGVGAGGDDYEWAAKKLEAVGFECLRSRRGKDGKFWEVWYLCGISCAKGELQEAVELVDRRDTAKRMKAAVDWLCRNTHFGSCDIAVQKAALVLD